MLKAKTNKRALLVSALALLVCVAMLIGSTYAWFTDTATTGVNTIQAGTLKIALESSTDGGQTWADAEGQTLSFLNVDGESDILWEPGCTYKLPLIRVRNDGNLALKYELYINGVSGNAGLLSAINFTANGTAISTFSGVLNEADNASAPIQIAGHMKESAGNEYQGLTLNGISITVVATQQTFEKDSNDDQYDATAELPEVVVVNNADELADALESGKEISLTDDLEVGKIDLTNSDKDVVIDGGGNKITTTESYGIETAPGKNVTITNADVEMTKDGNSNAYAAGFKIANGDYEGATITLKDCNITMANGDWAYAVNMPGSVKNLNLVIDNCTLEGAYALQCWGDNNKITITNSKLICNYTTNAIYTSACIALQSDGSTVSENNTLVIDNCEFSYSGVDNFNSVIDAVYDFGTDNNVTVTNCTYDSKVTPY